MKLEYIKSKIENIFYDNDISIELILNYDIRKNDEVKEFEFTAAGISNNEFDSLFDLKERENLEIHIEWEYDTRWLEITLTEKEGLS